MKQKILIAIRMLREKVGNKMPLVILGIFIMIYAGLFMAYAQHKDDVDNLESEIATKEIILRNPGPDIEALNEELRQAEETLANALNSPAVPAIASLPDSNQALELYEALVELAEDAHVELTSIQGSAEGAGEGTGLSAMPYSLNIEGDYENILGFISDLAQNTSLLKAVEFGGIGIQNSGSDLEGNQNSTLSIVLAVHVLPESTSQN